MAGKLYWKYGVMGSGKSLDLIRTVYNYRERGMKVKVYKPSRDTREGLDKDCFIKSRTGDFLPAEWLPSDRLTSAIVELLDINCEIKAIFVDESQFLSEEQIDQLQGIAFEYNVPVLCYGIATDFQSHLFPGSKRLMEIADDKQELIGICHCGRKAKQNARVLNGKILTDGDVVQVGYSRTIETKEDLKDQISYVSLCNKCYKEGRLE